MKLVQDPSIPVNHRILVIDDNPAIHEDFRKVLNPTGSQLAGELDDDEASLFGDAPAASRALSFQIDSAFQGQEGLEMVRAAELAGRPYAVAFVDVRPGTPDKKIHLVPEHLDREAPGGLYAYQPDPKTEEFPLALISPALATQISSMFGQLRSAPASLELSVNDAAARGIQNGDSIRVWNLHGEVHCLAKVASEIRDGVVVLPKGLWRKHTANGYTANALIPGVQHVVPARHAHPCSPAITRGRR